ncbi:hypothetical protein BDV06DRAFT_219890 [Aspergillus oleicola]
MAFQGKNVLVTRASMGIGETIARRVAVEGANIALFARSQDKMQAIAGDLQKKSPSLKVIFKAIDLQNYEVVEKAVSEVVKEFGQIDILVNNAGLALGAPAAFPDLKISDIITINGTNIMGSCMMSRKEGTILNVTSVTALEAPPFPGEAVVLALRPGVVATNFHSQRVGHDKEMYDSFIDGYTPLKAEDIANAAIYMLSQPLNISVKALDVVPSAQRSLTVLDCSWSKRNA